MESIKLYNGDCLEYMDKMIKEGLKVDCIVTDPPYGSTACSWDSIIPFNKMWNCVKKIRKPNAVVCLFGNEPFSSLLRESNLKEYRYDIYWQKERPTNVFQLKKRPGKVIETISVFYDKQPTYNPQMVKYDGPKRTNKIKDGKLGALIDNGNKKPKEYEDTGYRYPSQVVQFKRDILTNNLHPTQKPLALMEYLVQTYTNEGDIVLDFTMGSGTTGVVCNKLNRKFVGIELDNKYFEIAKKRIEESDE